MAPPVILLPSQFNGQAMSALANDVVIHAQDGWPPELTFDFSSLRFIRPAGVVFLSNLLHWLHEKGTKATLINCSCNKQACKYLDDSLFFQQHCGQKLDVASLPRGTTRPLQRIAHENIHAWLATDLVPWLAHRLNMTEASLYSVKTCISELFNNIQDHTRHQIGSIFVQHFPNESRVLIALSDFGLGIPETVRKIVPHLNDAEAILRAVQEGFTSQSTPGNKGVGLDYLLRTVVLTNGGRVTIYSLESIVRFERDGTEIQHTVLPDVGFCPGTTIDIEIRTDTIENVPDEPEDLTW